MSPFRPYWNLIRHNVDFRRLYLARLVSFAGDWFLVVPLIGLVYEASDSALAASAVLAAQALPAALLAPLTGAVSDRFDRKRILIISDVLRAGLALSLLAADAVGGVWFSLLIMFLEGTGAAFFYPASTGALPNVVDEGELPVATTLMSSAWGPWQRWVRRPAVSSQRSYPGMQRSSSTRCPSSCRASSSRVSLRAFRPRGSR